MEKQGLYHIRIHYFPIEGKSAAIERSFTINHEIPFAGAELLLFDRIWDNREAELRRDDRGNDLRPRQVEIEGGQLHRFVTANGSTRLYAFYFEQGEQIISLTALREPMAIDYIELYQEEDIPSYEELQALYEEQGLKPADKQLILVQGEHASSKSSPTLYPISHRSSPAVVPYDVSKDSHECHRRHQLEAGRDNGSNGNRGAARRAVSNCF